MILAIDPGPEKSAYVLLDSVGILSFGKVPNQEMFSVMVIHLSEIHECVIEQIAAMGMAVGAEVFETVYWSGKFAQYAEDKVGANVYRIKRHEVKIHLCNSMKAKDANIRQAIIDRYGGKEKAIGKKKTPGPLYGVSNDVWSALAIGLTFLDRRAAA